MFPSQTFILWTTFATICYSQFLTSTSVSIGNRQIAYLGPVKGKSYFSDLFTNRNWFEARQFCNESGMRLATINTMVQNTFYFSVLKVNKDYWTAGRDARNHAQFVWDHDQRSLNVSAVPSYSSSEQPLTCVAYFPRNTGPPGQYFFTACTKRRNKFTLCELLVGK